MNRREFCGTSVTLLGASALSGCAMFGAGNGGRSYDLSLTRVGAGGLAGAAALGPDDFTPKQRRLVADAVEGEARTYGHQPIDDGEYVEYDSSYYRVGVEETGEKTHVRPTLSGEYVDASEASETVEITRYGDGDIPAVKFAVATADESGEFRVVHRRPDETGLLPKPEHEYVEHNDRVVRLVVEEQTVTETEYTYTLERIATSEDEFESHAAETLVTATFRSANLSTEQEEMLRKAIEEDYYGEFEPVTDGYRDLLERFGEEGELPSGYLDTYAEYDGEYYRASVVVSVP